MKIAVVGCGAVGSYYGGRLASIEDQVHFLLRSDFEVVRRNGVHLVSPGGDFHVRPLCARQPEEIGQADLVLVALKTTANHLFGQLLPPLVGPDTAVLTLQNGLGNEEELARLFPPQQILGGLCFVCLNRLEPGLIQHFDHGQVVLGEFQRPPEERTRQFARLFDQAGVPCLLTEDLACAHWEKLTWNIPFNGLGVASAAGYDPLAQEAAPPVNEARWPHRSYETQDKQAVPQPLHSSLTTDQLLSDPRWSALVRELMLEVIRAARAIGFDLKDSLADDQIARTRTMGAYKASTLIDFERGQPLELRSLFLEPLRQARAAGANVPRLEALCRVLQALDRGAAR